MLISKKVLVVLAVCAAMLLAVAACGDDDLNTTAPTQSNGGGNTSAATQNGGQTDEPTATQNNGGGDGNSLKPCELLTKDEVSEILGAPVNDGISTQPGNSKVECEYDGSNPLDAIGIYLGVVTQGAEEDYQVLASISEPVDDLGDKAHWIDNLGTLEVREGDYNVSLQVVDLRDGKDDKAEAIAMAEKVLPRLP